MVENKYQLEDYYNILKPLYDDRVEVDMKRNKLGQPTVRVHYELNKLKVFDLFIFENGFAVAYKPNGKTKLYEHLTPKQARQICKVCIDWWMDL